MIGVIEFYQLPPKNYRELLSPGFICRAPISFTLNNPHDRIKLDYFDPNKPSNCNYLFEKTDLSDFDPLTDPSLRQIGIPSDEFILAVGYKNRPCVLVSDPISDSSYPPPKYQGFIVAPLYSINDAAGNYKPHITYDMVLRAQAYQFNNLFYFPESKEFGVEESFVRLDRMQFVRLEHICSMPVSLTEKAIDLLRQWSWFYQGCPIFDPALEEYIKKAKAELDTRLGKS